MAKKNYVLTMVFKKTVEA